MGRLNLDDGFCFRVYPASRLAPTRKDERMSDTDLDDRQFQIAVVGSGINGLPLLFDRHVHLVLN